VSDFDFNSVFSEFSELGFNPADFKMVAVALFFGFCIMMSSTTASSISLEGKNLWIIKSLPVKPETIFMGKMMLGLAVTLPIGIISSFLVYIGIGLNFFEWFVIFILVIAYGFLSSVLGLFMNLLFPKIEFKSPTEVVKQSASVGLTILAGMLLAVLPMIISPIVNVNVNLFILLVSGVYALLTYMIWFFVKTKGVKKFQKL
jgi:ABC-2 type transport system permease protein